MRDCLIPAFVGITCVSSVSSNGQGRDNSSLIRNAIEEEIQESMDDGEALCCSWLWLALTGTKLGLLRRELDDKGDN